MNILTKDRQICCLLRPFLKMIEVTDKGLGIIISSEDVIPTNWVIFCLATYEIILHYFDGSLSLINQL